jgi:ParB family chromosome partitioning protein
MTYFTKQFDKEKNFTTDELVVDKIPIEKITPDPNQVREKFDDEKLKELAYSIKERGILNPIHVRIGANEQYIILNGERRFKAAMIAGLSIVPCIVHKESLSEAEIKVIQLIENLQRQDLSALETSKGFDALLKQGMSPGDISRTLGVSESIIKKSRVVLKRLPENWLKEIEKKCDKISIEQLYYIAKEKNKKKQAGLYNKLVKEAGQIEIEETEQAPEAEVEVEETKPKEKKNKTDFDDAQLLAIWENLRKIVKHDKTKLVDYIPPKKMQALLEYGSEEA